MKVQACPQNNWLRGLSRQCAVIQDYTMSWPCGVKPNSKSIVILIESFNIMENVRVGLRQSKLGQNVEILYLNVNRTEKIRDSSDLQSLPEPNSLTDKTGAVGRRGREWTKLFRILSWWCWPGSRQITFQSAKRRLVRHRTRPLEFIQQGLPGGSQCRYRPLPRRRCCLGSWRWRCPDSPRCGSSWRLRCRTGPGRRCHSQQCLRDSRSRGRRAGLKKWRWTSPGTPGCHNSPTAVEWDQYIMRWQVASVLTTCWRCIVLV